MVAIKCTAFAHYPPRSDTSQDGGLVDLYESQKLRVLLLNILLVDCYAAMLCCCY
jgi:hypothetical protein